MKFVIGDIVIGVTAKHVGDVYGFPGEKKEKNKDYHNEFRVKFLRNGIERTFPLYGSTKDYYDGKVKMDERDLKTALMTYCDEAVSGGRSFAEFCGEFGYDEDSRSALATYEKSKKIAAKMKDLGFTEDELIGLVNYLNSSD